MAHINPFAKMNKATLKAAIEVDIDSRFNIEKPKVVKRRIAKVPRGAGNFLHLQMQKNKKAAS